MPASAQRRVSASRSSTTRAGWAFFAGRKSGSTPRCTRHAVGLEPAAAPSGEVRRLRHLHEPEHPDVELGGPHLLTGRHRQLHVVDGLERHDVSLAPVGRPPTPAEPRGQWPARLVIQAPARTSTMPASGDRFHRLVAHDGTEDHRHHRDQVGEDRAPGRADPPDERPGGQEGDAGAEGAQRHHRQDRHPGEVRAGARRSARRAPSARSRRSALAR